MLVTYTGRTVSRMVSVQPIQKVPSFCFPFLQKIPHDYSLQRHEMFGDNTTQIQFPLLNWALNRRHLFSMSQWSPTINYNDSLAVSKVFHLLTNWHMHKYLNYHNSNICTDKRLKIKYVFFSFWFERHTAFFGLGSPTKLVLLYCLKWR